jgi:capsid protein
MSTNRTPTQRKRSADARVKAAEAELGAVLAERRLARVSNSYDAVETGADNRRRTAKIERKPEHGILSRRNELRAINLSRDLLRNFPAAKSIDWQRRVNVVGTGPTLMLNTDNDAANIAWQDWFNSVWAKSCDARDDMPWAEVLACVLSALGTDGGCIVAVDTFLGNPPTGRLFFWTQDQMVEIDKAEWKNRAAADGWTETTPDGRIIPLMQERGIIRDSLGVVRGYVVTSEPGLSTVKYDEATRLRRGAARYIKSPWRLNQLVGVPEYLTMTANCEDLYEMQISELSTAKKAAKMYAWVKSIAKEEENELAAGLQPIDLVDGDGDITEATAAQTENYEAVEMLTGGYTDYLDPDDEMHLHDPQRPNVNIAPFFDHVLLGAGSSVGMARCYTTMQAQTSYTAFRGEMIMSWQTFTYYQKLLERRLCDWVAWRVIEWATTAKAGPTTRRWLLPPRSVALPDGWQAKLSWDWHKMPVLQPDREYAAYGRGLKVGAITWKDILGPRWQRILSDLGEQKAYIEKLGLPLDFFETVAGAIVPSGDE